MTPRVLPAERVRALLVHHHRLARPFGSGVDAVAGLLDHLRCIQLDPLDVIGNNVDLVAMARIDGLRRGQAVDALLPGAAFEHYAKERCLLPAVAFPDYRAQTRAVGLQRGVELAKRVDPGLLEDVLAEVRQKGPVTAADLSDRGAIRPVDYSRSRSGVFRTSPPTGLQHGLSAKSRTRRVGKATGGHSWKSTAKATTSALQVLCLRCDLVVSGRTGGNKRYDLPERALPQVADRAPQPDFARWAVAERAAAAGLLPTAGGPHWGMLGDHRQTVPQALVAEGVLEVIALSGSRKRWLAPAGFADQVVDEPDERMRILGPLDPLLWDRSLVKLVFGFEYVWEVYKKAAERKWGWYVVPLLHRGRLVGRLEARVVDGKLTVDRRWVEAGVAFDEAAFDACVARHGAGM